MLEKLSDAHCHLEGESLDSYPPKGVEACAICASFANEWSKLEGISRASVKKIFGIHPDIEISKFDDIEIVERQMRLTILPELEKYMDFADAIGEIGLDSRIADRVPIEIQKTLFETQLDMAAKRGLPAVIHCVGEWGALYDILRDFSKNRGLKKFLIHAASCSAQMAVQFEKIGARFSFGIRELSSKRGAECAKAASPERILTETDGECSAESLENAATALAALRGVPATEIADAAFENFHSFYSK